MQARQSVDLRFDKEINRISDGVAELAQYYAVFCQKQSVKNTDDTSTAFRLASNNLLNISLTKQTNGVTDIILPNLWMNRPEFRSVQATIGSLSNKPHTPFTIKNAELLAFLPSAVHCDGPQ